MQPALSLPLSHNEVEYIMLLEIWNIVKIFLFLEDISARIATNNACMWLFNEIYAEGQTDWPHDILINIMTSFVYTYIFKCNLPIIHFRLLHL